MTFSRDELMQAILEAQRSPEETPNSFTKKELRQHFGISESRAADAIVAAVEKGIVKPEMVARVNMHGFVQHVMGYVLVEREAN